MPNHAKVFTAFAAICVCVCSAICAGLPFEIGSVVAVDDFGRKVTPVSSFREGRHVGIFYFMWLGNQGENPEKIYNIGELLEENPEALWNPSGNGDSPAGMPHFFAEPLYGYYDNADPWVIRKHIELFIYAGVDFLVLDVTNGLVYPKVLSALLELLDEYRSAGRPAPQIVFYAKTRHAEVVERLYKNIYSAGLHRDLWFCGPYEKPIIISPTDGLSDEIKEFFHFRAPQWPNAGYNPNGFPYVDWAFPQPMYNGVMGVSVAQHTAGAFSYSLNPGRQNRGRGFSYEKGENVADDICKGTNIESQWGNLIAADPEIAFICGWNEWVALKLVPEWNKSLPIWVDTFNMEYSRDIEMMKGGYADNFYLQMLRNIRRYKGVVGTSSNAPVKIDISSGAEQWEGAKNYENPATKKISRNWRGFIPSLRYKCAKPDNFIRRIKAAHDADNLYFSIETDGEIVPRKPGAENWMNIFIGVEGGNGDSWNGFQYLANRKPFGGGETSLEKLDGGFGLSAAGKARYSLKANVLQIEIPRKSLGIAKGKFAMHFKVADGVNTPSNIADYYVSGEVLPVGRLAFYYSGE